MLIPSKWTKLHLNKLPFLLYDSGYGENKRMIVFTTPKFLSLLQQSNKWYADGTFKVVRKYFFQLYMIHAEKGGYVFPCVYALLPDKRERTYSILLRKLLEISPGLNPTNIMVDFEKAGINSFEEHFLAVTSGCFFHLSQNIYRKIQAEGLTSQILNSV